MITDCFSTSQKRTRRSVLCALAVLLAVLLPAASWADVYTGQYTGNGGASQAITGVPFAPEIVIVRAATGEIAYIRTSTMPANQSKPMVGDTALQTGFISSLDASGFTVGNNNAVNQNSTVYHFVAFETDTTVLKTGTYVGDGTTNQTVTGLGFLPKFIMTMSAGADRPIFRVPNHSDSFDFDNQGSMSDGLTTPVLTGLFRLGGNNRANKSGVTYHYAAFEEVAGYIDIGNYTGDGNDNRNITLPGFRPEFMFTRNTNNEEGVMRFDSMNTDESATFRGNAIAADQIQDFLSNGFQVGTHRHTNESSQFILYVAFGPTRTYSLAGTVFEDADYSGTPSAYDGGTNDAALDSVDVELYNAGTDAYISSTTTNGSGAFTFTGLADGSSFKIRIRSATIGDADTPPAAGLNACVPATCARPLPEMTWGINAALLGGQNPLIDDTATGDNAGPGDTYVTVAISGADTTGIDMGVAYSPVVNTLDDGLAAGVQSTQGSLRSFLKNSQALVGRDTTWFAIPNTDPNYNGTGNGEYTISPTAALPTLSDPVVVDGTTHPGHTAAPIIEIKGTGAGAGVDGLTVTGGTSTIRGLVINGFTQHALVLSVADSNLVQGNYVGTNAAGATAALNQGTGILINSGSDYNQIGGTSVAFRNVVSGNGNGGTSQSDGIEIVGTTGNIIQGNYIGTDKDGLITLGNYDDGIALRSGATNNIIGGTAPGAENVIADAGSGNLLPSTHDGIYLQDAGTSGNTILGNLIGTDKNGTGNLGNGFNGIRIWGGPSDNVIGGTATDAGNLIAFSADRGVHVSATALSDNSILGNRIHTSGGQGIDLEDDGATANDSLDVDSGANDVLNFPELILVQRTADSVYVDFSLDVPASNYRVEFFLNSTVGDAGRGEGEIVAGNTTITHAGAGRDTFSTVLYYPGGTDSLSATATEIDVSADGFGSTSEFSPTQYIAPLPMITGRVFEDADFAGVATPYDGGGGDTLIANVDVELYDADNADALVASTVTNAAGVYTFSFVPNGNYKVRVRSATLGDSNSLPRGSFLSPCGITDPASGPACAVADLVWANGSALYGGQDETVDDTATNDDAGPGDTYTPVNASGTDVTGVDFGFAYNLIVNTAESGQGSLGQFLANANAIGLASGTTANYSQFLIPGGLLNGNGVARISLTAAFPALTDSGTVIDGRTQTLGMGDTNPSGPEVEIDGSGIGASANGINVSSRANRIHDLIINGFAPVGSSGIRLGSGAHANWITGCYVGTDDAGTAAAANSIGIMTILGATGNRIGGQGAGEGNVIAFNTTDGVSVTGAATDGNLITGNSIFENGNMGIDLGPSGPGVGDGANNNKFAPVVVLVLGGAGSDYAIFTTSASGDTVEFFRVDNPAAPTVTADASGYGEGYLYLGRCVDGGACSGPHMVSATDEDTDAGEVRATVASTGITRGDLVTATATATVGTSEFGANATAAAIKVVKRAFLTDGTLLPDSTSLPAGTLVDYLIYINNPGGAVSDVSLQDVLPGAFSYLSGSLRIDNSVSACADGNCTPAEETAVYLATVTPGTDGADGDVVSVAGSTVHVGDQTAANAPLTLTAGKVWAVAIQVRVH